MPRCPQCHEECPKDVAFCRECGASLRRGPLRRLLDWLGGLFVDYTVTQTGVRRVPGGTMEVHRRDVITDVDDLPPDLREMVDDIRARDPGGTVRIEHSSTGPVTINEDGVTRTFESVDDLPPELRTKYGALLDRSVSSLAPSGQVTVNINGQTTTYDSIEDMPPELRARFEAMRAAHHEPDDDRA